MSGISSVSVSGIPLVSGRDASLSLPPTQAEATQSPPQSVKVAAVVSSSTATNPAAQSTQKPSKAEVNQALEDMIKRGQPADTSVQFSVDDKLDQVVIKVVDPQTNKVIKQFPAEAILKMREEMLATDSKSPPAGSLFSEKT
jgi:flagellar protein FlaG